jgi:hypothetical protein
MFEPEPEVAIARKPTNTRLNKEFWKTMRRAIVWFPNGPLENQKPFS